MFKSLPCDAHCGAQSYHGTVQLALTSVHIVLNVLPPLWSASADSSVGVGNAGRTTAVPRQQVLTALSLAVCIAHSGALLSRETSTGISTGAFNPPFGSYGGQVKPPKKAGKKGSEGTTAIVDSTAVASAVGVIQAKVLVSAKISTRMYLVRCNFCEQDLC